MAKKNQPNIKPKTEKVTRVLPVKIPDSRLLDLSREMAHKLRHLGNLEDEKKQNASEFAASIKEVKNEISSLRQDISSGTEMKPVACRIVKDFEKNSVTVIREDNNEVIEERAMEAFERQELLFEEEAKAEKEAQKGKAGKGKESDGEKEEVQKEQS